MEIKECWEIKYDSKLTPDELLDKVEGAAPHTYQALVSSDNSPDGEEYWSVPQSFANAHDWSFQGFEYSSDHGVPGFAVAIYTCSECDNPNTDEDDNYLFLWKDGWPSGVSRVCAYGAPLVTASITAEDSLDHLEHSESRVFGHSDEWEFKEFKWDNSSSEVKAYAVYYYDLSNEYSGSSSVISCAPPAGEYEYVGDFEYVKYMIPAKVEKVSSTNPRVAVLRNYKASVTAEGHAASRCHRLRRRSCRILRSGSGLLIKPWEQLRNSPFLFLLSCL